MATSTIDPGPLASSLPVSGDVARAGVSPDTIWWHYHGRDAQRNVFFTALGLRLLVVLATIAFSDQLGSLSRDSIQYDVRGRDIADQYLTGTNNWALWIDHGWFQFIGLVYFLFGPFLILIQLLNVFMSALSAAMVCRIAYLVTENRAATLLSGFAMALFPSIAWYCSLPLKDAAGIFALTAICLGILLLSVPRNRQGWYWIAGGLLLLMCLRVYLVPICAGCVALCLLPGRLPGGFRGVLKWGCVALGFAVVVYMVASVAGVDLTRIVIDYNQEDQTARYFDLSYINNVRDGMNSGSGRMYTYDHESQYGHGILNDIRLFGTGVFFFIFSIDIFNIGQARQLAALPEFLFFACCLPYLLVGVVKGWNRSPQRVLPLILFGLALIVVYSSMTTNMGAMYRWRMQALPFLIVLITYGAILWRKGPLYAVMAPYELKRNR
ncbi:hypothetical protein [Roseimaritima ulvae]|uniref:Glycosyltransferase RgtA/B/C/D-like domain-containing protein n=1 Tax=Roseimaritima ulvae TaxID=980254 RepID=A0A5B9QHR8_9BACT|nr:hypothetical protein [Roseimaritima ulvae]QEG38667.1 hypothetical protein UC8_06250 [Roseimaritima ulvae]